MHNPDLFKKDFINHISPGSHPKNRVHHGYCPGQGQLHGDLLPDCIHSKLFSSQHLARAVETEDGFCPQSFGVMRRKEQSSQLYILLQPSFKFKGAREKAFASLCDFCLHLSKEESRNYTTLLLRRESEPRAVTCLWETHLGPV